MRTLEYRIAGNFRMVQNFAFFADRRDSAKITTAKMSHYGTVYVYSTLDGAKLKNTKFSSGGLGGEFAKICTSENFPLYGT